MAFKVDWARLEETDGLCPGGCGKLHRTCCDSVLGEPHQSRCHVMNAMVEPAPGRPWWGRAVAAAIDALRRAA
jgi:hypothetical protein